MEQNTSDCYEKQLRTKKIIIKMCKDTIIVRNNWPRARYIVENITSALW